jgi:chemotaxis protein MotB
MNFLNKRLIIAVCIPVLLASCVPQSRFLDATQKQKACEEENKALKAEAQDLRVDVSEFDSRMAVSQRKIKALESDTAVLGTSLRILRNQYDKINAMNDQLLKKSSTIREGTEAERQALMVELEGVRLKLQEKEDALTQLEMALDEKEKELVIREERLNEMRDLISKKDSVMKALKSSVSAALLGFEGKGLTVEQRNGRVYVSMDAKLLFATGSAEVDTKGREAVIDLARAIQGEKDLRIMVEGHTDTDAFDRATFPRNNWDLSVLRATSVVSIMIENSQVDPAILTAAGRSQFMPVDPNNKAKNRRIEVILSPKLDDLMQLVNEDQN